MLRKLLATYDLRPTKGLGQNFLIDKNTIDRIVGAANIQPGEVVLEVGPGLGVLTQALLIAGAQVVAIEKDERLVHVLTDLFRDEDDFTLIHNDALGADLSALLFESVSGAPQAPSFKVVSNLPYYVTSPLLMHVLEARVAFERIVVMIQKEVAQRLAAAPGTKEYGSLSVAVNYYADVESVGIVPPTVFYPAPSVSSQIVALSPRACPYDVGNESTFFQIVRAAFGKRRKTLHNALGDLPHPVESVRAAFELAEIDPSRRGETLSLAEFAKLSAALSRL